MSICLFRPILTINYTIRFEEVDKLDVDVVDECGPCHRTTVPLLPIDLATMSTPTESIAKYNENILNQILISINIL